MTVPLTLNPDRLFPAEPQTRAVTRKLYEQVKDLPILSPHGHVPPVWIADDVPFTDPTNLLLTPDHYVNRIMHGQGVDLADLGVPMGRTDFGAEQARNAWRIFCRHWHLYRGTPMKYWMEMELVEIFGVDVRPSEDTADQIYDTIDAKLKTPEFRPRALMERFDIAFIATTDDPCDSLEHHQKIAADASFTRTVAPTFRPDKYLEPARPDWNESTDKLAEVSGVDTGTWAGWLEAMQNRRAFFKANGATSTDHSHPDLDTTPLERADAERLYAKARAGEISPDEGTALRRTMMFEQMRMASEDGLVMTVHPAVVRNHHQGTFEKFGADVGGDIPMAIEVVRALQPGLNAFGTHPNFRIILFGMDETVYSREVGPLAGFDPSVYVGPPWWFIDAPDAIKRWRKAVSEYGTFYKTTGFIDDTRAFMSIPARHDLSRRCDVSHLAELVVEGRLEIDEAEEVAHAFVVDLPRKAFNIPV
ncbi:MAG: glucuronate isomerase [Actinomycetes bacterium]